MIEEMKRKMRKRNHVVSFHLTAKELNHLNEQTATSGLPREVFLRSLVMGTRLRARPCTHHVELVHKVSGLCNNANQLAHTANRTGQASQQSVNEMLAVADAVWQEVMSYW